MTYRRTPQVTTGIARSRVSRALSVRLGNLWTSAQHVFVMPSLALVALATFAAPPLTATTTELESDAYSYGFVSRVEGDALLSGLEGDDAIEAEVNHPLLTGDQIATSSGRVELVLPDGTVLRVGPGTSLVFETLEGAPDSAADEATFLTLDQGELQIRTPETYLGTEDLAIQTSNAVLYLAANGTYRVTSEGSSFTEVIVRTGFVEADTRSGSEIARNGEALEISGTTRPFVKVVNAGPADSLELWAGDLDRAAGAGVSSDVDSRLAYAAAPLRGAGEWVYVNSRRAWRPYVRDDWRPFRYGRWVYTPSGLTWVASAPWGWVTSHYGSWDFVPGYGWLWVPGNVYSPAGVYWYWGPTHVGWIPYGYYSRYGRSGFRFGVYGWAGGDWSLWSNWMFCPTRYFGRRGYDDYWNTGRRLASERRFAVPRGVVTTDTRGLGPSRWGKPTEGIETLTRRLDASGANRNLPDVTDFVARRKGAEPVTGVSGSTRGRTFDRKLSARERLAPLPEERNRGRFGTRSVAGSNEPVRSLGRDRKGASNSPTRSGRSVVQDRGSFGTKAPARGSSATNGNTKEPSNRVRSVAGRRPGTRSVTDRPSARGGTSSLDRSVRDSKNGTQSAPVRRVLDRIRAHREAASGSSASSKGSSSSSAKGSSARSGSSKGSSRGSSSSAKSSGSNRSSGKSSASSRGSSGRSSASSGSKSSGSKSSGSKSSGSRSSRRPK